jgi:'Cold-shock' DNA-binding domain
MVVTEFFLGWRHSTAHPLRKKDRMPTGKIKMFNEDRGFDFIKPDDGGVDAFFHVSALREGDEIA